MARSKTVQINVWRDTPDAFWAFITRLRRIQNKKEYKTYWLYKISGTDLYAWHSISVMPRDLVDALNLVLIDSRTFGNSTLNLIFPIGEEDENVSQPDPTTSRA